MANIITLVSVQRCKLEWNNTPECGEWFTSVVVSHRNYRTRLSITWRKEKTEKTFSIFGFDGGDHYFQENQPFYWVNEFGRTRVLCVTQENEEHFVELFDLPESQ